MSTPKNATKTPAPPAIGPGNENRKHAERRHREVVKPPSPPAEEPTPAEGAFERGARNMRERAASLVERSNLVVERIGIRLGAQIGALPFGKAEPPPAADPLTPMESPGSVPPQLKDFAARGYERINRADESGATREALATMNYAETVALVDGLKAKLHAAEEARRLAEQERDTFAKWNSTHRVQAEKLEAEVERLQGELAHAKEQMLAAEKMVTLFAEDRNEARMELAALRETVLEFLAEIDKWPSLHPGGDYLHGGMQLRLRAALAPQEGAEKGTKG